MGADHTDSFVFFFAKHIDFFPFLVYYHICTMRDCGFVTEA